MNEDNVSPLSSGKKTNSKGSADGENLSREERLREELRKNLRKRKGQKKP